MRFEELLEATVRYSALQYATVPYSTLHCATGRRSYHFLRIDTATRGQNSIEKQALCYYCDQGQRMTVRMKKRSVGSDL